MEDKVMSEVQVLKQYFGYLPEQKGGDFLKEVKELPADERRKLAEIAAKELNVRLAE